MYEINPERQLELLKRLLFAWDAQWFLKSAAAFGPDEALKVNSRTRTAFGRLEMKAMLALLGKNQATNLADALDIIQTYHALAFSHNPILSGANLIGNESTVGRNKAWLGLARCAVLDNAKRAALPLNPSENHCIYCQMLWQTWLENLLPDAQIEAVFEDDHAPLSPHGDLTVYCFKPGESVTAQPSPNPDYAPITPTPTQPPVQTSYAAYQPPTPSDYPPPANQTAAPLIGGSEVGNNRPAPQHGSLRQRLGQTRPTPPLQPDIYTPPAQISSLSEALPPIQALVPDLRIDPLTGRTLFTGGMEQEIEAGVRSSKKKNFNLISRVMLSREAQEMLKKSAENPTPTLQPMTLASNLDTILQRLLIAENKKHPGTINQAVRFSNTPYGDLQIQVGPHNYSSIDEVPAGRVKELLQQVIATWQQAE